MEIAYLHIITNHIPIVGVPIALAVLAIGIWRKSDELKMASFLIFAFLGLATLATFLLGQGGEDFVEELAGISHDSIEDHEDFAKFALAGVLLNALVSAFAIFRYKGLSFLKRPLNKESKNSEKSDISGSVFPNWIVLTVLLLAVICSGLLGYTGKLGGKIRHSEFYQGTSAASVEEEDEDEEIKAEENEENEQDEGGKRRRRRRGRR